MLINALWVFRTTFKTYNRMSPYRLVHGKSCHQPVELEHRAYWVMKVLNFDLNAASEKKILQINEIDEFYNYAYESAQIYKDKNKRWYDKHILKR